MGDGDSCVDSSLSQGREREMIGAYVILAYMHSTQQFVPCSTPENTSRASPTRPHHQDDSATGFLKRIISRTSREAAGQGQVPGESIEPPDGHPGRGCPGAHRRDHQPAPAAEPAAGALLSGRKMFLAALMVASKYLLDRNYSNRAWAKIAGLPVEEINTNERVFLVLIDYRSHLDLDEFEVWSVRLQKLMREKRIGADRSEPDHHQPSSTVSSSSHSSPQRTSSSRPLSAHHSPPKPSSNTPSLKLGSPSKPLLRRPTLDLHTPIRQQAPRSDTRNGPATAPPRITQQRTGEDPSRTRQGSSDLTTPIRQQHALPPALAQAIPATAPAHLKPSGPSVCEPASTPLRRSTAPARQSSTPARQSSTPARQTSTPVRQSTAQSSEYCSTPIRQQQPLSSHPEQPPSTTHQLAPSTLRAELATTPARERMTPILSRPPLSNARPDLSIKQAVYGTPAISHLGSSNPPLALSPSLRAHREPSLAGTSSSLRRRESIASAKSYAPPTTTLPKRSATTLEHITAADVIKAEQDLMEKVAQEKALLAQEQEGRRPTPSSSTVSAKSSDHQHQQKRIDQQLGHERRMRDEEKKEHLRRLVAEQQKKKKHPLPPALELGPERWARSASIVSSLDRPRDQDHPSYPRRAEPSQLVDRSFERDEHLGEQDDSSSDSEQSSCSEDQLSDGLGYQARTSGEISLVQNRLYGLPAREEGPAITDYRHPSLLPPRIKPPLSGDARYPFFDHGQKAGASEDPQSQPGFLPKTFERIRFASHDIEPRDSSRSLLSAHASGSHTQPRSAMMGSIPRGLATPSSSGMAGYSGYHRPPPTYRGATPPLVSARPFQDPHHLHAHHHQHQQALSTATRTPSLHPHSDRRTEPPASRPPPALYNRPSPARHDDLPSGFPSASRRPSILAHPTQSRAFSDPDRRPLPLSSLRSSDPRSSDFRASDIRSSVAAQHPRPPSAASSSASSSSRYHSLDLPYYPLAHHHLHPHLMHPSYHGLGSLGHLAA
ncbi:hypothetical protein PTTG_00658, partial [Puccinia triticina 1-1 BBBD Race 1]